MSKEKGGWGNNLTLPHGLKFYDDLMKLNE